MARLEIETGEGWGEVAVSGIVTIGRQKKSSVRIDEPGVSRIHARIYHDGCSWFLEDLDSTTGTFLNGTKLAKPNVLEDGDAFVIGNSRIQFRLEEEKSPEESPGDAGKWVRKHGGTPFPVKMQLYFVLAIFGVMGIFGFRSAFLWIFDNHLR